MTTQHTANRCDGGHYSCSPPKECCKVPSVYRPPTVQTGNVFANPLFLGHWYFWLAVTATVAGILCACSLWRKHSQGGLCCRGDTEQDRTCSEPDSIGSCYAPPQYSRCNSFLLQQPPPPYSEVASKPDMYPLVISYTNAEPAIKNDNTSRGYLMVQYFRNFIVRPVGSLSATSTNDSLSSSFLCNVVNEANTIMPPTYSDVAGLDEPASDPSRPVTPATSARRIPRSASSVSDNATTECHQILRHNSCTNPARSRSPVTSGTPLVDRQQSFAANRVDSSGNSLGRATGVDSAELTAVESSAAGVRHATFPTPRMCHHRRSQGSAEEPFSALLNLSQPQETRFGVAHSATGSDISSLANLGTPDSPPRATSPTAEMRELLDKIQQLPSSPDGLARPYFHRVRSKGLYVPLTGEAHNRVGAGNARNNKTSSIPNVFSRSWLSRSAPCTPCSPLAPAFPSSSHKGSKARVSDGSPLLKRHPEESEDEPRNRDGRL